jgi:hypothetical protein
MLIYKNCFKLNVDKTLNNPNIILNDGLIVDTHTNIGYSVIDISIPKTYNTTTYIYYDVSIREFISVLTEYDSRTIDIMHPTLCPILIVTADNENITAYSYYTFEDLSVDTTPGSNGISITNSTISITEQTQIYSNKIYTTKPLLGILNIYVEDYGDLNLISVVDINNNTNIITLVDSSFAGRTVFITYLSQRVYL